MRQCTCRWVTTLDRAKGDRSGRRDAEYVYQRIFLPHVHCPSLLPVAMRVPSGDHVMAVILFSVTIISLYQDACTRMPYLHYLIIAPRGDVCPIG